jgi:heme iron utilization protein
MMDFNLYEFKVNSSEAPFGFDKAYFIKRENMNKLVARTGDNPHHKAK